MERRGFLLCLERKKIAGDCLVWIGPGVEQQPDDIGFALSRGGIQGRVALVVVHAGVEIGSGLDMLLDKLHVAPSGGSPDGGLGWIRLLLAKRQRHPRQCDKQE